MRVRGSAWAARGGRHGGPGAAGRRRQGGAELVTTPGSWVRSSSAVSTSRTTTTSCGARRPPASTCGPRHAAGCGACRALAPHGGRRAPRRAGPGVDRGASGARGDHRREVVTPVGPEQRAERVAGIARAAFVGIGPRARASSRWWPRRAIRCAGPRSPIRCWRRRCGWPRAATWPRCCWCRRCRRTCGTTPRSTGSGSRRGPSGPWRREGREAGVRVLVTGPAGCWAARRRARSPRAGPGACCSAGPRGWRGSRRSWLGHRPDACARAVAGLDAVVHLAAKVSVTGPHPEYVATNVDGTANLLEAAGPRACSGSSWCPPLGRARGSALVGVGTTAATPTPRTGRTRRRRRRPSCWPWRRRAGFAVCAVRPHIVLGRRHATGPADRRPGRAGRLPLLDDGTALIDTTYVDNAVDAWWRPGPLHDEGVHGEAFVVTNGEPRHRGGAT